MNNFKATARTLPQEFSFEIDINEIPIGATEEELLAIYQEAAEIEADWQVVTKLEQVTDKASFLKWAEQVQQHMLEADDET